MRNQKNKGSILVVSLLIMSMILVIALSLAAISVKNRQSSISSGKSVHSFQLADKGIETVLSVLRLPPTDISDIDNNITGASCLANGTIETSEYVIELKDNLGNLINCSNTGVISSISRIKSIGKKISGEVRAIEVSVTLP